MSDRIKHGLIAFYYNLYHSIKNVIVAPDTDCALNDDTLREWCGRAKTFRFYKSSKPKVLGEKNESKALLTFRSASLGDGAYHEIIQKFDGSVKVFHPTHNFLFPCPEDFVSRTIVLENLPASVTEEELIEKFADATNIFCFHLGDGQLGLVLLEFETERMTMQFKYDNQNLTLNDNLLKVTKCFDRRELRTLKKGKKLEDDTRVKMCEDIYNKRKAIQEVMNKEDLFGEDKIVECRKIYDEIEADLEKVLDDTDKRLLTREGFPEEKEISSLFIRLVRKYPTSSLAQKRPADGYVCFYCGEPDHIPQDCPIEEINTCILCGRRDHSAIDCSTHDYVRNSIAATSDQPPNKMKKEDIVKSVSNKPTENQSLPMGSRKIEGIENLSPEEARERIQKIMNARIEERNQKMEDEINQERETGGSVLNQVYKNDGTPGEDDIELTRFKIQQKMNNMINERLEKEKREEREGPMPLLQPDTFVRDPEASRIKIQAMMNFELNHRPDMGRGPEFPGGGLLGSYPGLPMDEPAFMSHRHEMMDDEPFMMPGRMNPQPMMSQARGRDAFSDRAEIRPAIPRKEVPDLNMCPLSGPIVDLASSDPAIARQKIQEAMNQRLKRRQEMEDFRGGENPQPITGKKEQTKEEIRAAIQRTLNPRLNSREMARNPEINSANVDDSDRFGEFNRGMNYQAQALLGDESDRYGFEFNNRGMNNQAHGLLGDEPTQNFAGNRMSFGGNRNSGLDMPFQRNEFGVSSGMPNRMGNMSKNPMSGHGTMPRLMGGASGNGFGRDGATAGNRSMGYQQRGGGGGGGGGGYKAPVSLERMRQMHDHFF